MVENVGSLQKAISHGVLFKDSLLGRLFVEDPKVSREDHCGVLPLSEPGIVCPKIEIVPGCTDSPPVYTLGQPVCIAEGFGFITGMEAAIYQDATLLCIAEETIYSVTLKDEFFTDSGAYDYLTAEKITPVDESDFLLVSHPPKFKLGEKVVVMETGYEAIVGGIEWLFQASLSSILIDPEQSAGYQYILWWFSWYEDETEEDGKWDCYGTVPEDQITKGA